jgi:hemerythrin
MALFEWKPIYNTGVETVDSQHLKLVGYMNRFHDAMSAGSVAEAKSELSALVRYTRIHFADEEAMMQRHKYSDFASHKEMHVKLLTNVERLVAAYQADPSAKNAGALGDYLKTWLANHILGIDKKYVPCVLEKKAAA